MSTKYEELYRQYLNELYDCGRYEFHDLLLLAYPRDYNDTFGEWKISGSYVCDNYDDETGEQCGAMFHGSEAAEAGCPMSLDDEVCCPKCHAAAEAEVIVSSLPGGAALMTLAWRPWQRKK